MLNTTASDKRQHKRIKKSCDVEFNSHGKTYRGVSDNFSIDGLFIKTDDLLSLQTAVSITVHLPDGSTSKVKGRVKRVQRMIDSVPESGETRNGGMGVEILERDTNYLKFFMSLLSSSKF